ncbi:TIGR02281 family clan AA aspartic protease [uncultured Jannaschia sp.]|uniref:retropepsin-like aspartic protease family protein n=1 Tax=uncultured Jannaschia sp. TaxID=293347 RepID=UPI002628F1DD|nr:TIGR02281 family clan AA aspartic protease [uncultured Jannaschia sp.]
MTGDDTAQLFYLTLLGVVLLGSVLFGFRGRLSQAMQQAAIWFFIFVGAVLVFGNWDAVQRAALPRQSIVSNEQGVVIDVPQSRDGHYYMRLAVNGEPVDFVVDTGASDLVLSRDDAARVGFDPAELRFYGQAYTANGTVGTADVTLEEVRLGDLTDRDVRAVVTEGDLFQSLLGMSYLQHFGRIVIEDGHLQLVR